MSDVMTADPCPHGVTRQRAQDRWAALELAIANDDPAVPSERAVCYCCVGPAAAALVVVLVGPDEHPEHRGTDVLCSMCKKGLAA